jgi:hypothetical protein
MKISTLILFLILGFLIGSTIGEIVRILVPEAAQSSFLFEPSLYPGFQPAVLNLDVIKITLGLYAKVNFFSFAMTGLTALVLLICELSGKGRRPKGA